MDREQETGGCIRGCQPIAPSQFKNLPIKSIPAEFVAFGKGAVCIKEPVICCDENIGTLHIVDHDAEQIGEFLNRVPAGFKNLLFGNGLVAYCVNGVVVDIDHILAADQFPALSPLHIQDIGVLDGHTFGVGSTKNFLPLHSGAGGQTIC